MTLILFTNQAPDPLAEQLSQQGHQVFEALAISEVIALADNIRSATIIIKADVHPMKVKVIQRYYPTMHLKAEATVKDILWELNLKDATVQ